MGVSCWRLAFSLVPGNSGTLACHNIVILHLKSLLLISESIVKKTSIIHPKS